jgi:glycosyltransferase involved in cell wall biosynthesis
MNILHTESSMNWGGQEFRTVLENLYLNQHGHQSWLLCHSDSQIYKKGKLLGANVVAMDLTCSWRIDTAMRIFFFCKKNSINLINSHGSKDSSLCLMSYFLGIPLIRSRQITNPIRKFFSYMHGCTHIMVAAHAIKNSLLKAGINENKITVIGEGVDLSQFNPAVDSTYLKAEFGIADDDGVVVNIGMIREDKGQIYFLEAARIILAHKKFIKFFIVGEGTGNKKLEQQLRALIKQYGIEKNVFITGYREDIAAFTHLANVIVVASISTEAQSRVVPQAFATRRTVVSTDIGGLTELVKDGLTGLVIPPKNAAAMGTAISRILEDKQLRQKLENNAFELAERSLSFDTMMKRTIELYESF